MGDSGRWRAVRALSWALACSLVGCSEADDGAGHGMATGGIGDVAPLAGAAGSAGVDTAGNGPGSLPIAGAGGTGAAAGAGADPAAGGDPGTAAVGAEAGAAAGAVAEAGTAGADVPPVTPPASCGEAAMPYEIVATPLDTALVPGAPPRSWAGEQARVPVTVAADGTVYVGFTRAGGTGTEAVVVRADATAADAMVLADAALGGIAATSDGVGALLFDPNDDVNARVWTAVARLGADGSERFRTDLFRSPNLDDEGTKGGASAGRIAYVADTDALVVHFGHTERYSDGVRHQGGYLATLDAAGAQSVISDWYGSHNLEQRLLVRAGRIAALGVGDAFPKGIFFNYLDAGARRLQPFVIYRVAADGVGAANAKLGGMVDLGAEIVVPFITNLSISQDLDAGPWPDTDETISMQIRDAAAAGTDLGLMHVTDTQPTAELTPVWLDAQPTAGAHLGRLKSARYGADMVLLAWAELSGSAFNPVATYYTMVVDRDGGVCQPKTALPAGQGFAGGDDLIEAPDGSIVWANAEGSGIQLLRLLP